MVSRVVALLAGILLLAAALPARAEIGEVRFGEQYGLPYLPLIVARHRHLIEQHAAAAGLKDLKVTWVRLGGGAATNDALLTGSIDFGAAGLGPLLTLWDRTRGHLAIRGVIGLDASAVFLNVTRPDLKSVADLRDTDRIVVPSVKVSYQAVLLQMAAAKAFGIAHYDRFDRLTVTLSHPDGLAALLSRKTEITGHFSASPYIYEELRDPRVHRLLSSEDLLGGLGTVSSVLATAKMRDDNPTVYHAVLGAMQEALALIARDKQAAAQIYVEEEKGKLSVDEIRKILELPSSRYSAAPLNTKKFADFMYAIGALKSKPASWHDYYFADIDALAGS